MCGSLLGGAAREQGCEQKGRGLINQHLKDYSITVRESLTGMDFAKTEPESGSAYQNHEEEKPHLASSIS
jgi:hypothetical protein